MMPSTAKRSRPSRTGMVLTPSIDESWYWVTRSPGLISPQRIIERNRAVVWSAIDWWWSFLDSGWIVTTLGLTSRDTCCMSPVRAMSPARITPD